MPKPRQRSDHLFEGLRIGAALARRRGAHRHDERDGRRRGPALPVQQPGARLYELVEAMLVIFVFHGMSTAFLHRKNITIDLIDSFVGPRLVAILVRVSDVLSIAAVLLFSLRHDRAGDAVLRLWRGQAGVAASDLLVLDRGTGAAWPAPSSAPAPRCSRRSRITMKGRSREPRHPRRGRSRRPVRDAAAARPGVDRARRWSASSATSS